MTFEDLRHVGQQPGELGSGEVGGQGQPTPVPEMILAILLGQLVNIHTVPENIKDDIRIHEVTLVTPRIPGVTPDHGIVQRLARAPVPEDGGLPLVGDPHPRQPLQAEALTSELLSDGLDTALNRAQQLSRPLLHPAEIRIGIYPPLLLSAKFSLPFMWKQLFNLNLMFSHHFAGTRLEYHKPASFEI